MMTTTRRHVIGAVAACLMVLAGCGEGTATLDDSGATTGGDDTAELGATPEAPSGLSPADGDRVTTDGVEISVAPVSGASSYQFEITYYIDGTFRDYYTYASRSARRSFWPSVDRKVYRWRARARNQNGWGEWSSWAQFEFGRPTERPEGSPTTDPSDDENTTPDPSDDRDSSSDSSDDEDTSPDPVDGAPTGLSPEDGKQIRSDSVTLACDPVSGADQYAFEIERRDGDAWRTYYTYEPGSASQSFWPSVEDRAYRWRVRVRTGDGWTPWSNWRVFLFGEADDPGAGNTNDPEPEPDPDPGSDSCGTATAPSSWTWPTPQTTWVCQAQGVSVDYQSCGFHTGTDMCGNSGEPILAMAGGEVVYVGPLWLRGEGVGRGPYSIVLKHGPDLYTTYGHNRAALVDEGDCVEAGDKIAAMGDKGYSHGPHLHVEMIEGTSWTGDWENPFNNACNYYEDPAAHASP